jgi:hypothetical protein
LQPGGRSEMLIGIKEKVDMEKDFKIFFPKKDFGTVFRNSCAVPI